MRITRPEIESLGWIFEDQVEGQFTHFRHPNGKHGKHNYHLIHTHKRDIITICDTSQRLHDELAQACNSIEDIKKLMKSKNILYENN